MNDYIKDEENIRNKLEELEDCSRLLMKIIAKTLSSTERNCGKKPRKNSLSELQKHRLQGQSSSFPQKLTLVSTRIVLFLAS